jgi:hypothetical protein
MKPSDMQKILAENVAGLYGFDLPALAPMAAKYGPSVQDLALPLDQLPDGANDALLKALPDRI